MIAMSSLIDAEFFKVLVEVPGFHSKFMISSSAALPFFISVFDHFQAV